MSHLIKNEQGLIRLHTNENPLGAGLEAMRSLQGALDKTALYPSDAYPALFHALSTHYDVNENQLLISNGSDACLEHLFTSLLAPGDDVIHSASTFLPISTLLARCKIKTRVIPTLGHAHDLEKMIDAISSSTRMIILVNPNNPTGSYFSHDALDALLRHVPPSITVLIDEAYADYAIQHDFPRTLSLLKRHQNLIILRTFSKIHGLAGLRIGYAITSPDIVKKVQSHQLPYHVNHLAIHAAIAALSDASHINASLKHNEQGKKQFHAFFNHASRHLFNTSANFFFVPVMNALDIAEFLKQNHILVRPLADHGLPNYIRVTIGKEEHNNRLFDALSTYTKGWGYEYINT